jgi:hypothetical protein
MITEDAKVLQQVVREGIVHIKNAKSAGGSTAPAPGPGSPAGEASKRKRTKADASPDGSAPDGESKEEEKRRKARERAHQWRLKQKSAACPQKTPKPAVTKKTSKLGPKPDVHKEMLSLWEAALDVRDGRRRCAKIFMELPSRRDYADYYKLIRSPISMQMIHDRILAGYYKSVDDLRGDFRLMFANARQYNVDGSQPCNDAAMMESVLL